MIDSFVQQHVADDVKSLTASEFEPFKFLSKTGFGKCIRGMTSISMGQFKKGEELIKEGASMGDPYSIYALYKKFASQNAFGVDPNKEVAWYYLICATVSFFSSLLYEESAFDILNSYVDTFDNEEFEKSLDIVALGIKDDCTPFLDHKDLVMYVFLYIMQSDQDFQKQKILEYLEKNQHVPREFILLHLFFIHNEEFTKALAIAKDPRVREYVTSNVKDYILIYTQSGTLGSIGTSVGLYNSVLFGLCYLIMNGKEAANDGSDEMEDVVIELYKFCSVTGCRDVEKLTGVNHQSLHNLEKLDILVNGIMAYLYSKGCYLKKNTEKALEYIEDFEASDFRDVLDSELASLRDYLIYISGYRIYIENGDKEKASNMLENIKPLYTEEELLARAEGVMPIDYFIAGYIYEHLNGDMVKARELYLKGTKVSNEANDYGKIMEFVAFKRKCLTRLNRIKEQNE